MPGDVKSKAQAGFLGSVIAGKNKKEGPSKEQAKRMLRGADVKNLPEKAKHYSKSNDNTELTVQGHRTEGDYICVELGEGKDSMSPVVEGGEHKPTSSARLCMDAEAAKKYPVGSKVVLHCVPSDEEAEASESESKMSKDGWEDFGPFKGQEKEGY